MAGKKGRSGRPPADPRGATRPKMLRLIPEVTDALEALAASKGYSSSSRLITAWIDGGCRGVRNVQG